MNSARNRKSGVALLIVIGMLALLMISAVAFTTMMRIERAGASNYRHAVTAREMVTVGLGRFIGDINGAHPVDEARINDDVYPQWLADTWTVEKARYDNTTTNDVYKVPEEVIFSVNEDEFKSDIRANVLSERMMAFVPGGFRAAVAGVQPEWIPVVVGDRIVGRYAYIALNTSGMLDINMVGSNGVERANGTDPAEIRVAGLKDVANATKFSDTRDDLGGYLTLEQVAALGATDSGLKTDILTNFCMFSYIPGGGTEYVPEKLEPDGKDDVPKLWVGGTYEEMDAQCKRDFNGKGLVDRMLDILTDAGRTDGKTYMIGQTDMVGNYTPTDKNHEVERRATKFIASFLDYIDGDNSLNGYEKLDGLYGIEQFNYPCVENIAQIAEIGVTADFKLTPGTIVAGKWRQAQVTLRLNGIEIRTWNVMDKADDGDYSVRLINTSFGSPSLNMNPGTASSWLSPALSAACASLGGAFTMNAPLQMDGGAVIFANDGSVEGTGSSSVSTTGFLPTSTQITRLSIVMTTDIELYRNGVKVDEVNGLSLKLASPRNGPLNGLQGWAGPPDSNDPVVRAKFARQWAEAADPRINWDTRSNIEPRQWWYGDDAQTMTGASEFTFFANGSTYAGYIYSHPDELTWPVDVVEGDGNLAQTGNKFPPAPNEPLKSVGELALIPLADLPFSSMRLIRHVVENGNVKAKLPEGGYHRLYDFFTVTTPDGTKGFRGLVNPNTRQTGVIGAVFDEMPVNEWASSPTRLTKKEAYDLGTNIVEAAKAEFGGQLEAATDLGGLDWLDAIQKANITLKSEAKREGLLRNSIGLFSTRQQSFLVLLRADAFTTKFGFSDIRQGTVLSTAQAVALVWRDPVPDEDGIIHPCFVQMLKIISNDEDSE